MKRITQHSTGTTQRAADINPCAFTSLGFLLNYISAHPHADLSPAEVHAAARDRRLLLFLASRYGHMADFYYLIRKPATLRTIEAALSDAAATLQWGQSRRIALSRDGLCLALAIVLQAIQQQFLQRPMLPNPETEHLAIGAGVGALSQFKPIQANSSEFKK